MNIRIGFPWLIVLLFSMVLVMSGCGGQEDSGDNQDANEETTGGPEGGIATYGSHNDIMVFWDPSDSYSNEIIAMNNMYETLLRYDPVTEEFTNILAEDYDVSEDGLTWTFKLREGVMFHTGNEMTAESAQLSIERTMERGMGASFVWDAVEEINVIDTYTLEFVLSYPTALDTVASSGYAAFIFDAEYAEENGGEEWFNEGNSAGTGPYMPEQWDRGSQLITTAFDDYWGGWEENNFQKVVFKHVPEANTRMQMVTGDELDFVEMLPTEIIESLRDNDDVAIVETESFQQLLSLFNTEKEPLNDPKVRQALAHAIPYDSIVNNIMRNTVSQSTGNIPKGLWGYDETIYQYNYDLDKAQELLDEAGVDGGELILTYASGDENERQIGELLKIEFGKLGFDVDLRGMLWEAQWDMARSEDPKKRQDILMMYWWPDYADPYSFMQNLYASEDEIIFNLTYYSNEEYDQSVDNAQKNSGLDREKSIEYYKQAQDMLADDLPGLSLYDIKYTRVIDANFEGYVDNPAYPNVVFFHDTFRK